MKWLCSVCGGPVSDHDMVGYFHDEMGKYVPETLGFWHNKPECGRENLKYQGIHPCDIPVSVFKSNFTAEIASYSVIPGIECCMKDYIIFQQRCLSDGYESVFRFYDRAISEGVIEPNSGPFILSPSEINIMLTWIKSMND